MNKQSKTEKPARVARNSKPLTAGQAFDRIRARLATQADREKAHAMSFLLEEAEAQGSIASRVPESERATLAAMLNAAKYEDDGR